MHMLKPTHMAMKLMQKCQYICPLHVCFSDRARSKLLGSPWHVCICMPRSPTCRFCVSPVVWLGAMLKPAEHTDKPQCQHGIRCDHCSSWSSATVTVGMYWSTCVTAVPTLVLMVHDKLVHFDDYQASWRVCSKASTQSKNCSDVWHTCCSGQVLIFQVGRLSATSTCTHSLWLAWKQGKN